jgi:hypothetical protein
VRGHCKDQIRDFKQVLVSLEARAKSLRESGLGTTLPNESAIRGNKMVCTNKSYALEGVQCLKNKSIIIGQHSESAGYPSSPVSVEDVYA